MITLHYFFCSHFLKCLSIEYWTAWIDSLTFLSPLSYCLSHCLFLLLSRGFLQLYLPIILLSCHFFQYLLKLLRSMYVFFAPFYATFSCFMAVLCSLTSLRALAMGLRVGARMCSCFLALYFPLSLFFLFRFLLCWILSLGIWISSLSIHI